MLNNLRYRIYFFVPRLYTVPNDSGQNVDIVDWNLSCDWPVNEDSEYLKLEKTLYTVLDNILKSKCFVYKLLYT